MKDFKEIEREQIERIAESLNDMEPGTREYEQASETLKTFKQMSAMSDQKERESRLAEEKTKAETAKLNAEADKAKAEAKKAKLDPWITFGTALFGAAVGALSTVFNTEKLFEASQYAMNRDDRTITDLPTAKSIISNSITSLLKGVKK